MTDFYNEYKDKIENALLHNNQRLVITYLDKIAYIGGKSWAQEICKEFNLEYYKDKYL